MTRSDAGPRKNVQFLSEAPTPISVQGPISVTRAECSMASLARDIQGALTQSGSSVSKIVEKLTRTDLEPILKSLNNIEDNMVGISRGVSKVTGVTLEPFVPFRNMEKSTREVVFDGVIAALTAECGGNVVDKGVVDLSVKSTYCSPSCVVDLENNQSHYRSENRIDQWVSLDFGKRSVKVEQYELRSACKSWVLEGFGNTTGGWIELDNRQSDTDMSDQIKLERFNVKTPVECSIIRLRQIGENHRGTNELFCYTLELYGLLNAPGGISSHMTDHTCGVIAYLTKDCRGNVHEKGEVIVSGNGTTGREARNVFDLSEKDSGYVSGTGPGQFICVDFKGRQVKPTGYALRSQLSGRLAPKSWILEGSADGTSWHELHRKENDESLLGEGKAASFNISGSPAVFRFIRFMLTGLTHVHASNYLSISALEIFGALI